MQKIDQTIDISKKNQIIATTTNEHSSDLINDFELTWLITQISNIELKTKNFRL